MTRASPTRAAPMARQPAPAPPTAALHIGIERVTLHGFAAADRGRFTRALEANLAELAAAQRDRDWRSPGSIGRIARIDAGELRPGESTDAAARRVARALFVDLIARGTGARNA